MDDFALFDDDRVRLRAMLGRIRAFLREERGLEPKEPATLLTRTAVGVPFLGLRVFPGTLRLRRRKIRRCRDLARRRIAEYLAGERDEASLQASLGSIVAHVEMGGSPRLRRAILVGEYPRAEIVTGREGCRPAWLRVPRPARTASSAAV
jgi:hypothetical protein